MKRTVRNVVVGGLFLGLAATAIKLIRKQKTEEMLIDSLKEENAKLERNYIHLNDITNERIAELREENEYLSEKIEDTDVKVYELKKKAM